MHCRAGPAKSGARVLVSPPVCRFLEHMTGQASVSSTAKWEEQPEFWGQTKNVSETKVTTTTLLPQPSISFPIPKSALYFVYFCSAITILFIYFMLTRVTGGHFKWQTPEGQKSLITLGMGLSRVSGLCLYWRRRFEQSSEQLLSKVRNGKIRSRFAVILLISNKEKPFCSW